VPTVKLVKSKSITDILTDQDISALEVNVLVALKKGGSELQVIDLIDSVRKHNAISYRFVDDRRFYNAIARLVKRKYLTYG